MEQPPNCKTCRTEFQKNLVYSFQFKWLSICKFCMYGSSMNLFAYSIANGAYNEFMGVHFTIFVYSIFKTNWFVWKQRAKFAFHLKLL